MKTQTLFRSVGAAGGIMTIVLVIIYVLFFTLIITPGIVPDMDTYVFMLLCCCPLPFLLGAGGTLAAFFAHKFEGSLRIGRGTLAGALSGAFSGLLSYIIGLFILLLLAGSAFKSDTFAALSQLQEYYGAGSFLFFTFLGYFTLSVAFSALGGLVGAAILSRQTATQQ